MANVYGLGFTPEEARSAQDGATGAADAAKVAPALVEGAQKIAQVSTQHDCECMRGFIRARARIKT